MNFFKKIDKIFGQGSRNLISNNAKTNLFRELTNKEKLSTEVFDFRNVISGNPNNNIIVTCEHATNNMYFVKANEKEKEFLETHWGYDIGAKDIGIQIAEDAEIFSIFTNFSRLIIDPNRSLVSNTLIREYVEREFLLSYNQNITFDERERRILTFYMPYYMILHQALNFLKPKYVISSHSFTAQYEDQPRREYEIGILFREKNLLIDKLEHAFKKAEVSYRLNEPYDPKEGVCHTMDSIITSNWPEYYTNVALLEFRNDYCSNPKWSKRISSLITPIVKELKDAN